jgi:hypothetical protein
MNSPEASKTSTGSTYRVVEFLEREGLASRRNGQVEVDDWQELLRRWSTDYGFVRTNKTSRWIALRGFDELLPRMSATVGTPRHAVTGSMAAATWAEYAPPRLLMVYVTDAIAAAEAWDLREADAGTNVLLAEPAYDVVLERATTAPTGFKVAAPSQVAADLMTGSGRNPQEAEALLDWMEKNEPLWRKL